MSITIDGKEYYGIIYKVENKITHEVYIGQTTNPRGFKGRYKFNGNGVERMYKYYKHFQDRNNYYNEHLFRAIKKYGFDAFEVNEIHDIASSKEELNEKEKYYIEKYDSFEHGYNNTYGGDSFPKGKNCKNSKPVCQIDLDGEIVKIWDSAQEASNELRIPFSNISKVCTGYIERDGSRQITAGGFVWVFEKDYDPNKDYKRIANARPESKQRKAILLLDENENVIQEFYSGEEASKTLNISKQTVSNLCHHKTLTRKYNLVFKSEYIEEQRLSVRELCEENSLSYATV